jgi:hypothetical protein
MRGQFIVSTRSFPSSGICHGARPAVLARSPGIAKLASAGLVTVAMCSLSLAVATPAGALPPAFLSHFDTSTQVQTTVPANGDVNPYGIVSIPQTIGNLVRGDTLVSNFNASSNLQGTGTTVVEIPPGGGQQPATTFAQINPSNLPGPCPGGVGLTTALTVLRGGFVVVGSLPVTSSGMGAVEPGCLIVLNSYGVPVETWSGGHINGPWDLTAVERGGVAELFVTNVLNGLDGLSATVPANDVNPVDQGTVVRLIVALPPARNPVMLNSTVIGTGFDEQLNSSALVVGPTGDAVGPNGTLYVADTVNSRIAEIPLAASRFIPAAGGGITLTQGNSLSAPLGMTLAPNGDIITVNGGNGDAVEITPSGTQIDDVTIDPLNSGGDLFGVTIAPGDRGLLFVDDGNNTLQLFGRMR